MGTLKIFEKYGHICDMLAEADEVQGRIPGKGLGTRLLRFFLKLRLLDKTHSSVPKYYRSHAAVKKEIRRHLKKNRYILHPYSSFRKWWEAFMVLALTLQMIIIPIHVPFLEVGLYQIANGRKSRTDNIPFTVSYEWNLMLQVIHSTTLIDIILNFFTGIFDKTAKEAILDPRVIVKKYLAGYFIFDVLTVVGILSSLTESNTFLYFTLMRFARIITLYSYYNRLLEMLNASTETGKILTMTLLFVIYVHWVTCLCILVSMLNIMYFKTASPDSWMRASLLDSEKSYFSMYLDGLVRSVMMITNSGYGNMVLRDYVDMFYTVVIWTLSRVTYFCFIANLLIIYAGKSSPRLKYKEMEEQLKDYMTHHQFKQHLQDRLLLFCEFRFQLGYFRENEIINTITDQLRQEVLMHSCKKLIENVPFFTDLPSGLLVRIVSSLKTEIFLVNEVIISVHTTSRSMYFINSGTVAVYTATGKEVCHLTDCEHFGEITMVGLAKKRTASVVAVEICEIFRLDQKDFMRAVYPYPDLLEKIEAIAADRLDTIDFETEHAFYAKNEEETNANTNMNMKMKMKMKMNVEDSDDLSDGDEEPV